MRSEPGMVWRLAFAVPFLAVILFGLYVTNQQRAFLEDERSRPKVLLDDKQLSLFRRHPGGSYGAIVSLDLKGQHLSADDLDTIASFTSLERLDLSETDIGDDQLAFLKNLSSLRTLCLNKTKLTNAAIPQLGTIPNLDWLEVEGCDLLALTIGHLKRKDAGHYRREPDGAALNQVYSVHVPVDRFLLMRSGRLRMALKFTKASAQRGAEYVCYWQPAPEGPFVSGSLRTSQGELFERYLYVGPKDGNKQAIDLGGRLEINCGPFKVSWSSQTWVYLPLPESCDDPPWQVALTNWSELNDIDFGWKGLQWCRGPQADYRTKLVPGSDQFFHGHVVSAPLKHFVLLRRGTDRMAVMLGRCMAERPGECVYISYWQPDRSASFAAKKTLKKREGRLFEDFQLLDGRAHWRLKEPDGVKLDVDCGPLKLVWSSPTSLYFPEPGANLPALQMAETTWTRLEEIDFEMKELKWYKRQ